MNKTAKMTFFCVLSFGFVGGLLLPPEDENGVGVSDEVLLVLNLFDCCCL